MQEKLYPDIATGIIKNQMIEYGKDTFKWSYTLNESGEVLKVNINKYWEIEGVPEIYWIKDKETIESEYKHVFMENVTIYNLVAKVEQLRKNKWIVLTVYGMYRGKYTYLDWKPIKKTVLVGNWDGKIELKELLPESHYRFIKRLEADGLHPRLFSRIDVKKVRKEPLWTEADIEMRCIYVLERGELYTAHEKYYANDVIRDGYDNIIPHEEICTSCFLTYLMSHYYDGPNTAHLKPLRYIPAEHYEDDYLDYLENYKENFAETWC